jgi:hypothetical protein
MQKGPTMSEPGHDEMTEPDPQQGINDNLLALINRLNDRLALHITQVEHSLRYTILGQQVMGHTVLNDDVRRCATPTTAPPWTDNE